MSLMHHRLVCINNLYYIFRYQISRFLTEVVHQIVHQNLQRMLINPRKLAVMLHILQDRVQLDLGLHCSKNDKHAAKLLFEKGRLLLVPYGH